MRKTWILVATAAVIGAAPSGAGAETIRVELNKLDQQANACRAYMVFRNDGEREFGQFKLDLVLFAGDGVISGRVVVDAAPVRAQKTSVKLFDIPGASCESIGRVLVNDVTECAEIDGPERRDCITLVTTESRTAAELVK